MAGLRKGIQVTNEFDGYEPPEDTRAYGDAYAMEDEEEEKREPLNSAKKEPSRRTMSDVAGASSGAEGNLDSATGGAGLVEWEIHQYYCFLQGVSGEQ